MQLQKLAIVVAILIQGLAIVSLLVGVVAGAHGVSTGVDTPWSTIRHPEESPDVTASFYPILSNDSGLYPDETGIYASRTLHGYL